MSFAGSPLADELVALLGERRLACAESCTSGRLAAELAAVGDAEQWFAGGVVAYQTPIKRELLGVTSESVVTTRAAAEMAEGAARLLASSVAVATTGVFGDEPVDGVEPGTVFVSSLVDGQIRTERHRVGGDPRAQCDQAVQRACEQLVDHLAGA